MATVIDKTEKTVKNLGWLIRHASSVRMVELMPQSVNGYEVKMQATLADGRRFLTDFANLEVCKAWLKRRCLRHATICNRMV